MRCRTMTYFDHAFLDRSKPDYMQKRRPPTRGGLSLGRKRQKRRVQHRCCTATMTRGEILFNAKGRYLVCLYFFAKLRDFEASLLLPHPPPLSPRPSSLSPADPISQPEECRKPHGTRGSY